MTADGGSGADRIAIDRAAFGLPDDFQLVLIQGTTPLPSGAGPSFLYETAAHRLWFYADGTGAEAEAQLVATFDGIASFSVSDFVLL